ncbi:MAG TPA: methyltransferase domain-containing protein [Vicinamibacteria bacterium]|nr:methyltransferase domain-containing protein [Vicinamibacteria bacterium]
MPPSTSPACTPPAEAAAYGLPALERFYRLHAAVYDWTRPLLLFGRRRVVDELTLRPGEQVLDVGCGTGWSLPRLAGTGARVIAVEPSAPMRRRAAARLSRLGLRDEIRLDPRPYGVHPDYEARLDAVLFSYSLSMIPPFDEVLARARRDLRPGGRIGVVDFLDARGPVAFGLRRSHVHLGATRLDCLRQLFQEQAVRVHSVALWRYYLFVGGRPGPAD